jgi:mannose/fructose/N-acetylgalactosamine-specific phosphotransferase system component IIB
MAEIVMHRVDDRLVHGQVIVGWVGLHNINAIWIVDDEVANNPMMVNIYKFAAPAGVDLAAMTIKEAGDRLLAGKESRYRVLLLAKIPQTFVQLMELGYQPQDINFGAMAHKPDGIKVGPQTELTREEADAVERLYRTGVRIWIQLVPQGGQKPIEWEDIRQKCGYQ